ncbi:hypothetical protein [Brazilian marseillevirus]|uniref:hypothetical protein n=1 Tax=Brazilian marseillevirus TaxID=1813599 RepID=UPI000783BFDF|nr:hypothetical protein A3303_gp215 [Brazilian marseillevirus]AMQ10723.1 hypothetical protein [Brazilian marseillevirus]
MRIHLRINKMSCTWRKEVCITECILKNKEEGASLVGTSVCYEENYPESFTGLVCRSKCDTFENSKFFEHCERAGWRTCKGSLKECQERIEKHCHNTLSAKVSKALFFREQ